MRPSLAAVLNEVAAGRFPAADGGVTILLQPSPRDAGVIGLTAHAVIFIDADPAWVAALLPPGDLSGPLTPAFLQALCRQTGRRAHSVDVLATVPGGAPLWAQVAPANAASMRAFLAAGFVPVGAEALLTTNPG